MGNNGKRYRFKTLQELCQTLPMGYKVPVAVLCMVGEPCSLPVAYDTMFLTELDE